MKTEIKAKWTAALRSGKYKQARKMLRDDGCIEDDDEPGYCCLGVLCELMGWDIDAHPDQALLSEELYSIDLTEAQQNDLMEMNDGLWEYKGKPQSFEQIANHIEESL